MMTANETRNALRGGPLYADFDRRIPVLVWVLEHRDRLVGKALRALPEPGFASLVWALVEASSVSRSRDGVEVNFWNNGATGWFPDGNACLP